MNPETIIQIINRDFGVDIKSKKRHQNYVFARDIYCNLAVELFYPHWNYSDIAKTVNRNHATILYAIRKPKDRLFKKTYEKYLIGLSQNLIELDDEKSNNKRNEFLENEIVFLKLKLQDLEETIENNKKETFLNKLNKFDKHKREELKKRFELIMDMESRKIYNFRDSLKAV